MSENSNYGVDRYTQGYMDAFADILSALNNKRNDENTAFRLSRQYYGSGSSKTVKRMGVVDGIDDSIIEVHRVRREHLGW